MMQRLIAWLLERYTPFRVVAWDRGKIAGIGYPARAEALATRPTFKGEVTCGDS